jgi:gas vesicle protein
MTENNCGSGFGALFLGAGVGLALGLLFAPRSGEETREIIVDKAKEGMACAADAVEELKLQVEVGLVNAGDAVQHLRERAEDAVAEAREKLQEAVRVGQDAYRTDLSERQTQLESFHTVRSVS